MRKKNDDGFAITAKMKKCAEKLISSEFDGNISKLCEELNIARSTFYRWYDKKEFKQYINFLIDRYTETELFEISTEQLAMLEEYVYIWDIDSDEWTEEWNMNPLGFFPVRENEKELIDKKLCELNEIRKRVIIPILSLRKAFSGNAEEISKAVYDTLMTLKVNNKLKTLCNEYLERGDSENSDFIMQSWDSIMQLLDNMVRCYSNDDITADEYINMLGA